jgi:uncharacterized phage-associated protein
MPSPTTAAAVANWFLDRQSRETAPVPQIDQMKIQKLVFYAHAWWLALQGDSLFDDDVYAWPWGPVVQSIYGQFREYGRQPIGDKRATVVEHAANPRTFNVKRPDAPPENVQGFLEQIWNLHKGLTGIQLSNATHAAGEPWTVVRDSVGNLDGKPLIPNDLIRETFRRKLPAQN